LFLPKEIGKHLSHDYEQVTNLSKPTMIMRPRENEKTQADFLKLGVALLDVEDTVPASLITSSQSLPSKSGPRLFTTMAGKLCC